MRKLSTTLKENLNITESADKKELLKLDKILFAGGKNIDAGSDWEEFLDVNYPKLKNLKDISDSEATKALKGARSIAKKHNISESFDINEAALKNKEAKKMFANKEASLLVGVDYPGFGRIKSITAIKDDISQVEVGFFGGQKSIKLEYNSTEQKWLEL